MQEIEDALERYKHYRIRTGGFLNAVLENDLEQACVKADCINRNRLFEIVSYVANYLPPEAWGSPEKVRKWLSE